MLEILASLFGVQMRDTVRHLLVNASGEVVDVVMVDPLGQWRPPEGLVAHPADEGGIGWQFDGLKLFDPRPPPPEPPRGAPDVD